MKRVIKEIPAEATWTLRHTVLRPEKELDYIKLPHDAEGKHYGLFEDDTLVSVISLFVDSDTAQFRKFATRLDRQGQGCGTALLQHVFDKASELGAEEIWCSARVDKIPFYAKFGLAAEGEVSEREGIWHQRMRKTLAP